MKYIKMLGLAAIAAAALTASVGSGSASATELTCNGVKCSVGTTIHATSNGHVVLHPPIGSIECRATMSIDSTNAGSPTTTAVAHVTFLEFFNCTNGATVHTLQKGTMELHSLGGGNGTLKSTGASVTVVYLGFHCIFGTNNTDIGTVTTNTASGGSAKLDIVATIPRTGGSSGAFCGSTAQWTGSYTTTKPTSLIIH